ncbi:hypothetical protein LIER_17245 [Lithospermum erythrorhizon]|uniref:Uncharacterized protein n=1 Tax=Lithospermum erythrorhizon TaxID=34254 RepID=A0AAV3QBS5_LITER
MLYKLREVSPQISPFHVYNLLFAFFSKFLFTLFLCKWLGIGIGRVLPPRWERQRQPLLPKLVTEHGAAKEDEVDHLEVALVRENSLVYRLRESVKRLEAQLSSALQELRQSTMYAQHVVELREERTIALLAAQTAKTEVERLTELVADLQSRRLFADPPLS